MLYYCFSLLIFMSFSAFTQNKGYTFKNGYCQKKRAAGYNPNYLGECGMFTGARITNHELIETKMTGINLNGSTLYRSKFSNLNFNNAALRRSYIIESTFKNVESKSFS